MRAIRSTQRSTAESIPNPSRSIFRKPASAQESLSHCTICRPAIAAGTTGQQSISGRVATHHPAGVLGEVARQPLGLRDQAREPRPALRARRQLVLRGTGVVLGRARHALDLTGGQAQHLAQLADRPARAERREGRHQRRALGAEVLVHARDQHLADVAGEVEVDVGQALQARVQEAPEQQPVADRVDVREAREVADDRGDRGTASAAGRQQRTRG